MAGSGSPSARQLWPWPGNSSWESLLGQPCFLAPGKGGQSPRSLPSPHVPWDGQRLGLGKGPPCPRPSSPTTASPPALSPSSQSSPCFHGKGRGAHNPLGFSRGFSGAFTPFREIGWLLDIFCCCGSIQAYTEQEIKHLRSSSCEESVCLSPSLTLIHEQASSSFLLTTAPSSWSCRRPKAAMGRLTGQTVAGH